MSGAAAKRRELLRRMLLDEGLASSEQDRLRPRTEVGRPPLSAVQRRMWFLQQLHPGSAAHNISVAVRLTGPLDADALCAAFHDVVIRHEILRTTYDVGPDGSPVQVLHDAAEGSCRRETGGERRVAELARELGGLPFDLAGEPPLRARLVQLDEHEHVLLLVAHHIAVDDASWEPLFLDLAHAYRAHTGGAVDPLPALAVQYADFAAWERNRPVSASGLEFWQDRLTPPPAEVVLPRDRARSAVADETGGRLVRRLAGVGDRIQELCRQDGATPYMLLLAACTAVLHHYSGADDITVGSPVVNRDREELAGLVGNFGNLVVLRADASGDPSFRELVHRVRETCADSLRHQDVPFDAIVEHIKPEREPGRSVFFDVLFSLRSAVVGGLDLPGVTAVEEPVFNGTAEFDLSYAAVLDGDLTLELTYRRELFDDPTADRLLGHLGTLLRSALADPDLPLSALALLEAAEHDTIVRGWNQTARAVGEEHVAEQVSAQAARTPQATAVSCQGRSLTYAELEAWSNHLAHRLVEAGAGPEQTIAVALPRSVELVVALLAVLKSGAAYLPIDPDFPAERIAAMLEDAQPLLVLDTVAALTSTSSTTSTTDLDTPPSRRPHPESPAYVIYTSGSTGRPKGVVVTHRGLTNFLADMTRRFGIGPADRWVAVTTVSFDIAALELYAPLVSGASVELAPRQTVLDPWALGELAAASGATIMQATPSLWQAVLDAAPEQVRGLRMLVGGEALPADLAVRMQAAGVEVVNLYGPTETTIWSTACLVDDGPGGPVIGSPIANTTVYVLDRHLRPVPAGVPGDLYIAGDGLARGYRGRPDLTAERFVADPYGAPGARMYRTGDLARWTADGQLDFLGRTDHQVKVRGFRIELGEIEAVLGTHPDVGRAIVTAREDRPGDKRLVAYVVPAASLEPDPAALRSHVAARLPGYMVPSAVVVLDELPTTPNGKVDRAVLPAPDLVVDEPGRAPRNPREEVLCGLFAEVLGLPSVGIDNSFFTLGGHSLLVTRLVARIQAVLGLAVPIREVFDAPTVAHLAERLVVGRATRPTLTARSRAERVPLSRAQQRLWFLSEWEGPSATYNLPLVLRLRGTLDRDALQQALTDVLARHESLRTVVEVVDGVPHQRVVNDAALALQVVASDPSRIDADLAAAARHTFDLTSDLPVTARLFALADDEHALLLLAHHIAGDEWSVDPLAADLATAYDARCRGAEPQWPALPVQYADYALWQRDLLGAADDPSSVLAEQTAFWTEALRGMPTQLPLPTDRPRPAVASNDGGFETFELPAQLHRDLRALAQRTGTTSFMVLQAGLAALLSRLGAGNDIPIGTPIAGRADDALRDLVGFLVNTLVLRTDVSGNPTFAELLARVRDTDLAAFDHADVPFDHLVEAVNPTRSLSAHPLFQVALGYRTAGERGPVMGELETTVELVTTGTAKFDLTFVFTETPGHDGLAGAVEYRTDLFDRDTVHDLAERLTRLLATLVAAPDRRIGTVDILGPEERQRILVDFNATGTVGEPATVPALFAEQARLRPHAVALEFETAALTYREVDQAANRLARRLVAEGVGPERVVAVAVPRSAELVIALLAVLKAGGAYLALDPDYPADRLAYMVGDAEPSCVVSTAQVLAQLPLAEDLPCVVLDDPETARALEREPADALATRLQVHNAAYVIYTSGSTGRPKGVVVTHEGVAKLVATQTLRLGFGPQHAVTMFSSPSFDLAFWEMCVGLLSGGRLVVFPSDRRVPGPELADYLRDHRVTHTFLPPSMLSVLPEDVDLPTGIHLLVGTEAVSAELVRRWAPGRQMVNCYGPTEATVNSTLGECRLLEAGDADTASVPIGRPDPGVTAYVLDENLQPVPVGVTGELYLSGIGLARGYHGQPGLTATRFVANPYGGAGARMYRTGDLARWDDEGRLDFLGRADDQVKIRGFRIEPGEIAAMLSGHADVAHAVVVARQDHAGGTRLVAYVAPEPGAEPDPAALRRYAAGRLPNYMVPTAVVVLDRLPTLPNGKLDKQALPAPDYAADSTGRAPRTPQEETLCEVFAHVLGVDRVGIDDDFFSLGGHSLLVTRLISRIRTVLGAEVAVRTVFEAPTVAALAERLGGPSDLRPPVAPVVGDVPLSFAQQRLWFLHQLEGRSPTYNIPAAFRLTGALDVPALQAALDDMLLRHEVLRTVFPERDGKPVRRVLDGVRVPLDVRDIPETALAGELTAAARVTFDLAADVLVRATLLRLAERDQVLLLNVHHIAADGWSVAPLTRDLGVAYAARCEGRTPEWSPLPATYGDYAAWQRTLLGDLDDPDSRLSRQVQHWTQALSGMPDELTLPTDRPRPARSSHEGDLVALHVPASLADRVRDLAAETRVSPFMVFQAAFATLLTRLGAGTDIPLGTPVAGRTDEAFDDLVGFFVNTLVLRTDTSGDPSFRDLLDRVRAVNVTAYEQQDLPFERLVEALNPARSEARHPLFQVMLVHHDAAAARPVLSGLEARPEVVNAGVAKMDLTVTLVEQLDVGSPAVDVFVEYATDLFDRTTADSIGRRFVRLLESVVAEPDQPISAIDVLTTAERQAVLEDWNDTAHDVPASTLPELFAAAADRTPDALALAFGDERLTYAELDDRVSRLAHLLVDHGVGQDRIVAVAAPRSVELVVALYAVHRAGGAYLPIDPDYPADRIAFMLEDAAPAVVLTTSAVAHLLPAGSPAIVLDDASTQETVRSCPGTRPQVALEPHDAAYVIYTSGTTGRPKGVVVPHQGIVNRLLWMQQEYQLDAGDRVLQKTPSSFDVSVWEFFWPLLVGATLVVAKPEGHKDPAYLASLIQDAGVTTVHFVPSMLRPFLAEPTAAGCTGLRRVVCSGEALPAELVERFHRVLPSVELHNLYGPTEAAVDVTAWPCTDATVTSVPIGRPVWNTQLRVLDADLRPVPPGVPGELYLAGVQLARGYHNRASLTAERFVADPYGPPGTRMYRTGDLVRWRADGAVDYLGRVDAQVKLRGFRIELGEIEAVAVRHPSVVEAAVVLRSDGGTDRLVAYVVPGGELDTELLRRELAATLPEHMVPSAFVVLDALPLSPSGKLDRAALPAPVFAGSASSPAAETPWEQLMCELYAEVLGLPEVGVDDGFFALGGDSILSIQLVSRALAAGLVITPRDVFRHQTPMELAAVASTLEHAPEATDDGTGIIPATPVMHWLRERGGPIERFSQSLLLRTPADLDEDRLVRLLQALLDRHDALRARFDADDWSLHVPAAEAVSARDVLLRVPAGTAFADLVTREAVAAQARLRPAAGLMLQAVWLDAGPDDSRLLLVVHHLVVDGVSWHVLLADLQQAWQALVEGREPGLAAVPTSYRTWAVAEQSATTDAGELAAWESLLDGGATALADRPLDPATHTAETLRRLIVELPAARTEALLTRLPGLYHAGADDVLLTGLGLALGDWAGVAPATGVLVDVEGHGRDGDADLSRTVGWFTTVAPARLMAGPVDRSDVRAGGASAGTALKQVKESRRAVARETWGRLRYLDDESGARLATRPRRELLFNYLGRVSEAAAGDEAWSVEVSAALPPGLDPEAPVAYPLEVNAVTVDGPDGQVLRATWSWPAGLFRDEAVRDLAGRWFDYLAGLAAHADRGDAGGVTASDLTLSGLTQDEIDEFEADLL